MKQKINSKLEVADGFDANKVLDCAERILQASILCSMATVNGNGSPHINTAYFAYSKNLELVIITPPSSAHASNLAERPNVALTVFNSHQEWGSELQGLQLFGTMKKLGPLEGAKAFALYAKRFPVVFNWQKTYPKLERATKSRFYRFTLESLKLFDEPNFGKDVFITAKVVK